MSSISLTKKDKGRVLHIELNTPEKRNVLNGESISRLIEAFQSLSEDLTVQVVILSGKGPSFCAGGDLRWMLLPEGSADTENFNSAGLLFNLFHTINRCPVPVIGKIHGAVYGGGIGLVSVCDVVVSHTEAEFCFSELKLSLIPSVISPFVLKKMPLHKAKLYMLSAQKFSAEEAEGLVHFTGSEEECEDYINSLTDRILQFDRQAVKQAKDLLRKVAGQPIDQIKEYCVEALARRRSSPDAIARMTRFLKAKDSK
ncbi:MAG: enoyl-CoA hydratase-related protein [Bdellovibrionales bacterium]|nr:enoyl-CoA hydratase-related protein [Bdellovibrionales bacterium]